MNEALASLACLMLAGVPAADTPEGKTLRRSSQPVVIARRGKTLVPIVISPAASEAVRHTATLLQEHLGKITGGEFRATAGPKPDGITLGTLEQFPDPALAKPLEVRRHRDGLEAFVIRSDNGVIRLVANTELGVSHAAHRFLELLGCRWFFMTDTWQIIPDSPTVSFDLNEDSRPDIWSRTIWFDRLSQHGEPGDPDAKQLYERWKTRNRMAQSLKVQTLHRWHAIPTEVPERFEGHPEYFALVDGKRRRPQFCVSNRGLQEAVIAYARRQLEAHPEWDMVSIDPADNHDHCGCSECLALGPFSCQPFYLANIVARAVQRSHPGKYVGLLSYSWYSTPPPFELEPNVYVQLTRGLNAAAYHPDELYRMWVRRDRKTGLGVYEYYCYSPNAHELPGNAITGLRSNAQRIRRNVQDGVTSINAQAMDNWGVHGLAYYVANRVMWDSSLDVAALRQDVLDQAFGPAAGAMDRFYRRFDADHSPLPGMGLIRGCADDLQEASRLAAGRPPVLARIDDLKKLVVYSFISEQRQALTDKAAEKKLALEQLTWAYRIRNSHMVGWINLRSTFGRPWSEQFKEPDWFWRNTIKEPGRNPWRVDRPVAAGELDGWMQRIRQEIPEAPAPAAKAYSTDYVLVDTGEGQGEQRALRYSIGATFLLASVKGEPIQLTVEQAPWGRNVRPDAEWTLRGLDGKGLASGRVPIGVKELSLAVPKPGVYRFWCYSRGPGYRISFPAETHAALEYQPHEFHRQSGLFEPACFHVPRGLDALHMYAHFAGTVRITDGSGQVRHEAPSDGRIVTIPVPDGQDGRVWSVGGVSNMRLRRFGFLNLPTVLSLQRRYLIMPREMAKADNLKIVAP